MNRLFYVSAVLVFLLVMVSSCRPEATSEAPAVGSPSAVTQQLKNAVCVVGSTEGNQCHGTVRFESMADGKVKVTAEIKGLTPNQQHAIHVHEFGDITDLSGKSAGGHFNPEGHPHGLPPAAQRHAGDLGNLTADAEGNASLTLTVDNFSISDKNAIIGRAVVVHALPDDGGQPTGNAGDRIGVGVIGVAK